MHVSIYGPLIKLDEFYIKCIDNVWFNNVRTFVVFMCDSDSGVYDVSVYPVSRVGVSPHIRGVVPVFRFLSP